MDYKHKYLKYKNKYLELQTGGEIGRIIDLADFTNFKILTLTS